MKEIKQQAITGVRWNAVSQLIKLSLYFVTSAILARLLQPVDFGLLGMAMVFTSLVAVFNDFGLGSAVIQSSEMDQEKLSGIFWITLLIGIGAMGLTVLCAPWIAAFYETDKLQPLLYLLSTSFFLSALGQVQLTLLIKRIDFKKIAIVEILSGLAGNLVAIILAFLNFGVWSLAAQIIVTTSITTCLLWWLNPWRPSFEIHFRNLKNVVKYSAGLFGFNIVNYFSRNSDYLLIGKFLGANELGIYSFAYRVMQYPIQNITGVVNRVLFPTLAKIKDEDEQLRVAYKKTSQLIAAVIIPLLVGVFILAKEFTLVVFGEKWLAAIPIIQVLVIAGLFQSLGGMVGNIYTAKGRTRRLFYWGLFSSVIAVGSIVYGLKWGVLGVAVAYASASILLFLPNLAIPFKLIGLRIPDYLWSLHKQIILVGVMGTIVLTSVYIQRIFQVHQVIILLSNILLGGIVYIFSMIKFDRITTKQLINAFLDSRSDRIIEYFKL